MNYCRRARMRRSERGAALIIAVFVLALALVMITALSTRFVVAARRTDNQVLADQAWYYLTGAEQLATELLLNKLQERAEQQDESLFYPELFGQFDTDDGWLAFSVMDLQGRFNLNNLAVGVGGAQGEDQGQGGVPPTQPPQGGAPVPVPNTVWQQRFVRLLMTVEEPALSEPEAIAITEAVVDWVDDNVIETGFGGAEQTFYAQGPLPYRSADMAMRDDSELLLVKGVSPEIFNALQDSITVWPREGAAINVGSAGVKVIQSLYDKEQNLPLAPEQAGEVLKAVREGEITTLAEFIQRPEFGSAPLKQEELVNSSQVFLIRSETQVGRIRQALDSVVQINDNQAVVLARSMRML